MTCLDDFRSSLALLPLSVLSNGKLPVHLLAAETPLMSVKLSPALLDRGAFPGFALIMSAPAARS
jgi:hypothetical protein